MSTFLKDTKTFYSYQDVKNVMARKGKETLLKWINWSTIELAVSFSLAVLILDILGCVPNNH